VDDWKLEKAHDHGLPLMERYRSTWREGGLVSSILRLGWWSGVRLTFKVWNRLTVHGQENLPTRPPLVLIANHASHLDALVLASLLPLGWRDQLFPLAAKDVFFEKLPTAGFAAAVLNALPVWRTAARGHALADLRQRLVTEPGVYILFPEGKRTRDGTMAAFKPGIGMLVAGTPVPVVPCYVDGTFEALPANSWLLRPRRITVRLGKPLIFEGFADERAGWTGVAGALETAVRDFAVGPCAAQSQDQA
jgi:1-acyl-sn-glycerol-3-phosphate acyltransferase